MFVHVCFVSDQTPTSPRTDQRQYLSDYVTFSLYSDDMSLFLSSQHGQYQTQYCSDRSSQCDRWIITVVEFKMINKV